MNISLNEHMETSTFEPGEVLFREGESCDSFYIVTTGKVACVKSHEGRNVVINVGLEKTMVGEDSALSGDGRHAYSAVALENIEVVKINTSEALAVIDSKPEWIKSILENISGKVRNTMSLVSEHRIEDDRLFGGEALSDDQVALIKNSLEL